MRGRPGPGALIGVAVGASLVFFLIWLPEALLGDTEGGAMFYMGLPLMTISTAVGALIGVAVGASLVFFLIWLPETLLGATEGGAMFYMGLPLMTISTAVGALIGVPDSSVTRDERGDAARRPLLKSRAVVAIVAGTAVVLAEWFFLMATGAVSSLL